MMNKKILILYPGWYINSTFPMDCTECKIRMKYIDHGVWKCNECGKRIDKSGRL